MPLLPATSVSPADAHVLAALRASGGGLDTVELTYQMRRRGRPHVQDLAAALQRLEIAGLIHKPYDGVDAWSAVARSAARA